MKKYIPSQIESKWQKKWRENGLYLTDLSDTRNKYYILVELPYTSGDLHMGHWFTFTMGDILVRFKKRQGFNVLFPNGFDAFGLPAENAAIKQGIHPRDWTYQNMERMREQFETLGTSIDWTKTMVACDPKYYKWNQWIFLKMLEKGLAYRGKLLSNWCPEDATVLANENVENGKCWRCGTEVIQKEVDQWLFRITSFADRLLWSDPPQADWPKPLRVGQNDWIGKSEGMEIEFPLVILNEAKRSEGSLTRLAESAKRANVSSNKLRDSSLIAQNDKIVVYTVFPETIFGVTYMVLAPEHPLIKDLTTKDREKEVEEYVSASQKKSELERKVEEREKTGVFTGAYCINPVNDKKVPIWIADYVLAGYGTGAVMGVPGSDHRDFEFAEKYGLEIIRVIGKSASDQSEVLTTEDVLEEGVMVNSAQFSGLKTPHEARERIKNYLEEKAWGKRETQYHLHDWSISRQRYWGTPIPIIYCDKCGTVPVPEKNLPVELPYKVDYAPKGKPPLATAEDWVNTECPKCGGPGKREAETMDTFVDSAWYFFRYLDPENDVEIFDKDVVKNWMPLEIYIGGPEHTLGHALYSRFFTMVFRDLGLVSFDEYAKKRIHHGTILGPDGARMSKSRGNVVNLDTEVKNYGADAIRLYLMFLGPFDIVTSWKPDGINGVYHFLQRIWGLYDKVDARGPVGSISRRASSLASRSLRLRVGTPFSPSPLASADLKIMHKTIKKVTEDIEELKYNTAIAALMEWLNHLSKKGKVEREEYRTFLLLLAPFAPHMTEELWQILRCHPEESSTKDLSLASLSRRSGRMRDTSNNGSTLLTTGLRDSSPAYRRDQNDKGWSIHQQSWPKIDNKFLEEEEVSVVVQVNGKVRDILVIGKDLANNKEVVEKIAKKSKKAQKFLAGKFVEKVVYIPGKIISFVVGS